MGARPTPSTMKTGYKEMLRDRIPITVNIALKWCNAKQKWIDHSYNQFVKVFKSKTDRYETTRIILGISKKQRDFNFNKSIDWDSLTEEQKLYWNRIESWVIWFKKMYSYIVNDYEVSLKMGKDISTLKGEIISKYLTSLDPVTQERFANYLIKNLQKGNY